MKRIGMGFLLAVALAHAQQFPRFSLAEGAKDQDGFPTSGAKLCALPEKTVCYQMPPQPLSAGSKEVWQFGLTPQSERLDLADGGSLVFFTATFSAGGSGTLERLAVLRMDNGRMVNLLPFVGSTNVSDRAMWKLPDVSPYPVLVHADFLWGKGQSHFEPHFFQVEAFRYERATDRYAKVFSYKTSRKYDGGDVRRVQVLAPERAEIMKRLNALPKN